MRAFAETIVAPITGTHPAPVAVLRLSGPDAWRIASSVVHPWPESPVPRKVLYGRTAAGDEALAVPFEEGRSYTGEQSVEISVHGSPASVRCLLDACIRVGARMAQPGEFTLRAFVNGRMDLTQAEAVRDTIESQTARQLRQASLHRMGRLAVQIRSVVETLETVRARIEATIDFSEEIGDLNREEADRNLSEAQSKLAELRASADSGRLLRNGVRLALAGLPNAGKSSLLNRILGMERSIVSGRPGTTRDYVEERIEHSGIVWVVLDTAGLADSADEVEAEGVRRARRLFDTSDFVWYLYDAEAGWTGEDDEQFEGVAGLKMRIANKSDLAAGRPEDLAVSALTGQGIDSAFARSIELLGLEESPDEFFVNERHGALIERALCAIRSSRGALVANVPDDLASVGIAEAVQALGEITGDAASDDVIEQIFGRFCIGK